MISGVFYDCKYDVMRSGSIPELIIVDLDSVKSFGESNIVFVYMTRGFVKKRKAPRFF